jgi:hypothetical protein
MDRLGTILAILIMFVGVAFAQNGVPAGAGSAPGAPTTTGSSAVPGSPAPGASTPAPSNSSTVGRAPGINPMNSQDLTHRSNPSDLTSPTARNPQDLKN